jgi:hypothetical protein
MKIVECYSSDYGELDSCPTGDGVKKCGDVMLTGQMLSFGGRKHVR